ncbi:hypothetical protein M8494_16160 [Serratia ureilytica]
MTFIANQTSAKRIWISNPSWPNHKNVFSAVGWKCWSTPTTPPTTRWTLTAC